MVATLTTHNTIDISAPVLTPDGESAEQQFELELGTRPGACRGVRPHASDWLSCLERRDTTYLPI